MVKTGVIVFATGDCKEGRDEARVWLKGKGLTPQDVRLYALDGLVLVETLRPVKINLDQP